MRLPSVTMFVVEYCIDGAFCSPSLVICRDPRMRIEAVGERSQKITPNAIRTTAAEAMTIQIFEVLIGGDLEAASSFDALESRRKRLRSARSSAALW